MFRKIFHKNKEQQQNANITDFSATVFGFYWSVIKRFPLFYIVAGITIIAGYMFDNVTFPYTNKWAVQIFESAVVGQWNQKVWWIVGIYLTIMLIGFIRQYMNHYWRPIISRYASFVLYKRVYKNDTDFFINRSSGQVISQMGTVCNGLNSLTLEFYTSVIKLVLGMLVLSVGVLFQNVWIALMIVVAAVLRTGWRFIWQRKINAEQKKAQDVRAKISGIRTDSLGNALTAKLFGNIEYENKYIWNQQEESIKLDHKIGFLRRMQDRPSQILWFALCLSLILMCWYFIKMGTMSLADGMFVFAAGRSIARAFDSLIEVMVAYSEEKTKAIHAYTDIILPCSIVDAPRAKSLKNVHGEIEFDDVSFNYGKKDVIKHFDLNVSPREKIGIVGLSGAGKTTLVNLILRAYDVKSGAIKIDGYDVRDVKQDSLHKNISFVPQEAVLFNRSLLENIKYARPSASKMDVIKAAKKANIHDFISGLPDGYNTLVGNRGIKLSGGQRQRIAIARALLKDSPVLILDEATSALDSENELLIQKSLKTVMRGKTTIAIAHRLSTLRNMDRIIVLDKGRIVESGTHAQLLRSGGAYSKLWKMQTGGFVGE